MLLWNRVQNWAVDLASIGFYQKHGAKCSSPPLVLKVKFFVQWSQAGSGSSRWLTKPEKSTTLKFTVPPRDQQLLNKSQSNTFAGSTLGQHFFLNNGCQWVEVPQVFKQSFTIAFGFNFVWRLWGSKNVLIFGENDMAGCRTAASYQIVH